MYPLYSPAISAIIAALSAGVNGLTLLLSSSVSLRHDVIVKPIAATHSMSIVKNLYCFIICSFLIFAFFRKR